MTRPAAIFAAALLALALAPSTASAELYKYRGKDGEVIITTQKRGDLELIEVVGGSSKKASKSRSKKSSTSAAKPARPTSANARKAAAISDMSFTERSNAFDDIIREASKTYDVPFGFVKAVIRVESAFRPDVVSHAGAMGLMQLMPRTAASLNVTDAFDPRQNIFGGTKFLRILIDRYDGDINLILAAYNAGDAAVARYDGIPYAKTRGYVASVYKWYQHYSNRGSE
jgi:soluble lytic murein transglycosylase-like protein